MAKREFPKAGSKESRAVTIQKGAIDAEKRTVDLAFSSEKPVPRWWGIEVLSHQPGAMDMSRMQNGGAVLLNHNDDQQVGVVDNCRCDPDMMGRATVRFSRSALGNEVFQDVADGIRKNVSVGYSIDEDPVQMKPDEMDDEMKNQSLKENSPVYRINRWTPLEISMVPIPADTSVGVNRSARSIEVCAEGKKNAMALAKAGKVDRDSDWSFSAEDGNKILGDPPDYSEYEKWFLAEDTAMTDDTKGRFKYPFGKDGKVYRKGIIAAKQRSAQQGETAIEDAADAVLKIIDKDEEKKSADVLKMNVPVELHFQIVNDDSHQAASAATTPGRTAKGEKGMKTADELAAEARAKEEKDRFEKENREAIRKEERERRDEIDALVSRHDIPKEIRDKWDKDGLTIEQVRHNVLKHIGTTKPIDTPPSDLGLSEGDRKRYSISRAITAAITNDWSKAGFERECSMAIDKRISGEGYNIRGTFRVPYDVPLRTEQRTVLTAGAPTTGGDLVGTTLRPDLFIELLRNKMISTKLGIQMLSGLVGNIAIPSFTAAATAYWVAENAAPTAGNQTFGQITLSPKTVGAYTDFSRQLLLQATPAIDGLVQGDLSKILALAIDLAVFHGTASNGQPRGIDHVQGIGSENGATLAWTGIVDMETQVAAANADVAGMKYVTNATVRGLLKGRPKVGTTYPVFMIGDDGNMNGYPVLVTNQIAAGDMFFGDFTQIMMGEWGVLDILVDPYSGSTAGTVRIVAFESVDVAVRHPVAFTLATSIT